MTDSVFPGSRSVTRWVRTGAMSKAEILSELQKHGVQLNESGKALFADPRFTTSESSTLFDTVEISVADLGYEQGATTAPIHERAVERGLALCPLELGPHLRLQFLNQAEGCSGHPPSSGKAPPGSITVMSAPLSDDQEVPKGFYLRRIKGVLWLRGYCCDAEHVWSPEDRLLFCRR